MTMNDDMNDMLPLQEVKLSLAALMKVSTSGWPQIELLH